MDHELIQIILEQVGPLVPIRRPVLKTRFDPAAGLLFVTLPEPGRTLTRHALNPTGSVVYRLLDGSRSVGDVIGLFSARFPEIPEPDLARDIVFVVRALERKKLIEPLRSTARVAAKGEDGRS